MKPSPGIFALPLCAADVNTSPSSPTTRLTAIAASPSRQHFSVVRWCRGLKRAPGASPRKPINGLWPSRLELLRQGLTARRVIDRLLADDTTPARMAEAGSGDRCQRQCRRPHRPSAACRRPRGKPGPPRRIPVGQQCRRLATPKPRQGAGGKLYAALKARRRRGDSRGRQSASSCSPKARRPHQWHDRYIYINVDDSPAPIRNCAACWMNLSALFEQVATRTSWQAEGSPRAPPGTPIHAGANALVTRV
jgi:hypothetical protein